MLLQIQLIYIDVINKFCDSNDSHVKNRNGKRNLPQAEESENEW